MVDPAEIRQPKGGDIFVVSGAAGDDRKLSWWLGGFRGGPDDIRSLNRGVRKMIDRGELRNIQDETATRKLAQFISVKIVSIKTTAELAETIQVGGIKLFERTDKCLHI